MKTSKDAFAATATTSTHPASVCPCVRSRPIATALAVGLALSAWAAEPVAKEKPAATTKAAPGATPSAKSPDGWESLFDGKTLTHWKATDFGGKGEVKVAKGEISLGSGYMTGITFTNTNTLPRMNYEVELDYVERIRQLQVDHAYDPVFQGRMLLQCHNLRAVHDKHRT